MSKCSHQFISVMGTLGTGKSTAAILLSQALHLHLLPEAFEDNPFLPRFYTDMKRWGLTYQTHFLLSMMQRTENAKQLLNQTSVVEDSSIFQYVYSYAQAQRIYENMDQAEWQLYIRLYETMKTSLPVPDLIVYLDATVETILTRVAQRGRDYENSIPADYLHLLNRLNAEWLKTNTTIPVCHVDANALNIVENPADQKFLVDSIIQMLPTLQSQSSSLSLQS